MKNERMAFKYFETLADKDYVAGQLELGNFYKKAIGIEKDLKMTIYWNEKAASNGNI